MGSTNFQSVPNMQNGLKVGSGTQITKVLKGTVSVNPASVATLAVTETSITISGAVVGDTVIMTPPAAGITAGLIVCDARVSATDTVKVRIYNSTAGTVDEAAADWAYCLIRA